MNADELAREEYCYLTTTGRTTGQARRIEIWFAMRAGTGTIFLLAGGGEKAHWVRNIQADPRVTVEIGGTTFPGTGRIAAPDTEEDALARDLVVDKYEPSYAESLQDWKVEALPVAIDLDLGAGVPG
jgi:deazaflavin-dependent oxidoreductase (nitroreductase family)